MIIPSLHFPHISRIFSAKVLSWAGNLVLWVLFLTLVSVNVFLWAKPPAYSDRIFQIFTHPFSATTHEDLAQALWYSGERTLADQELAIVAELSPVLGADTTAKAQRREADKMYWQHVLATHPDYRDAYIQLAALSYQDGNLTQANAYLVQAQALDPNNAAVNRLTTFTSKLLE